MSDEIGFCLRVNLLFLSSTSTGASSILTAFSFLSFVALAFGFFSFVAAVETFAFLVADFESARKRICRQRCVIKQCREGSPRDGE